MSSPIFLSVEQVLDLYFAELPDGVYATDRADSPDLEKRSYSSSELRAHSEMVAVLYENLQTINQDKFISTVTNDGLTSWERDLFAEAQDSSQPYNVRQQNLLAKARATGGISRPVITSIISGVLTPQGLAFDVIPLCGCNGGVWILEVSRLDIDTFLSIADPLIGANPSAPLDCDLDYVAAGITLAQLQAIQTTAYTYLVKIYGVADATTLALLDRLLTQFEPARSTHILVNNAESGGVPDNIDGGEFTTPFYYTILDNGLFTEPDASYSVIDGGTW